MGFLKDTLKGIINHTMPPGALAPKTFSEGASPSFTFDVAGFEIGGFFHPQPGLQFFTLVDRAHITPAIPEPSTYATLGVGLAIVLCVVRMRGTK